MNGITESFGRDECEWDIYFILNILRGLDSVKYITNFCDDVFLN